MANTHIKFESNQKHWLFDCMNSHRMTCFFDFKKAVEIMHSQRRAESQRRGFVLVIELVLGMLLVQFLPRRLAVGMVLSGTLHEQSLSMQL